MGQWVWNIHYFNNILMIITHSRALLFLWCIISLKGSRFSFIICNSSWMLRYQLSLEVVLSVGMEVEWIRWINMWNIQNTCRLTIFINVPLYQTVPAFLIHPIFFTPFWVFSLRFFSYEFPLQYFFLKTVFCQNKLSCKRPFTEI